MHDRRFLVPLIAASALAQLLLAIRYFGFLTGDDVEVLCEAFRRARGLHYQPWDVRNLFVPDFVHAPAVWLATQLGVESPRWLMLAATLPSIVIASLTIALVYALALRWSSDRITARVAALLFALHWIPLGFGSTTYPRVVATACVVAAALLVERFPFLAGALIGVAFADRFSEIVFLAPLLLLARKQWWRVLAGACVAIALTVGAYDWLTWSEPFGSARKFAHLTLVEPDFASRIKWQSPVWYLQTLPRWLPLTLLPLLWYARRPRTAWLFVIIPLIALSAVKHKELRYLHALIPFVMILAAIGFARMPRRRVAIALVAISCAWGLWGVRFLEKKTMPAVEAAMFVARDANARSLVMSQPWAYGDRLYLGNDRELLDVGTPPVEFAEKLRLADTACLYESDIDESIQAALAQQGFREVRTFRWPRARDVVVFRRSGH